MSGAFLPLFGWTLLLSTFLFFLLWGIFYCVTDWNPGDAFLQLTNPSTGNDNYASGWEWLEIVVMNLFGLFILNGVVLTLLVNWVSNRKDRHEKGEARYDYIFTRKYSVIIGGHRIVASLARDLMATGLNEYILIQTQRDPQKLRKEISAAINNDATARKVIIYSGDRTSLHELEELHLEHAREVYLIGESFAIDGTSHDAINMHAWDLINRSTATDRTVRIPCHVMFEYQSTFSAFQFTDLKLEQSRTFRFIPFSIYENWAQQVLISRKTGSVPYYLPLDGPNGLPYSSHQRVHLIIVGMSKMGMSLAIEAAHLAHYPNFNNPHAGHPRTLITFIDRNARREMTFFMGRFRELFQLARWRYVKAPVEIIRPADTTWDIYDSSTAISQRAKDNTYRWHDPVKDADFRSPYYGGYLGEDLIDIDFEFIEGDVALPSVQKYISDACADCNSYTKEYNRQFDADKPDATSKTTIAVCLPVAAEAMSTALYFEPSVYRNVQQIWVQQSESGALVDAIRFGLTGHDNAKFRVLRPFGMIDQCDYLLRINDIMPKIIAYAYDCMDRGLSLSDEYSTLPFDDFINKVNSFWLSISHDGGKSAIAKRWSNIYCANSFDTKIRATGIDLSTGDVLRDDTAIHDLARVEHNRWVLEQLLLGIRPVAREYEGLLPLEDKSERKKLKARNIHPDLISNEKLGSTKTYDEGIARIIPLALAIAAKLNK